MSIVDDIRNNASDAFGLQWATRNGTVVPNPEDLKLSNDAVEFKKATILYADLDSSTDLVSDYTWSFAGEVYKSFLYSASRIIRYNHGSIVSYDGDRVMGVFIGDKQRNNAVSCALEISWSISNLVQPELSKVYGDTYDIDFSIGIDMSQIRAARTGVRGDNDLVWIGNAANIAAKLSAIDAVGPIWITKPVFNGLKGEQKFGADGELIWQARTWDEHDGREIYSTHYRRELS